VLHGHCQQLRLTYDMICAVYARSTKVSLQLEHVCSSVSHLLYEHLTSPTEHFSGITGNLEMSGNSAKVRKKSGKRPKVRERRVRGICVVREILLWQIHKMSYLFFICTVINFFIPDVHGEIGLINVHLFDILPAISSRKVEDFFLLGEW